MPPQFLKQSLSERVDILLKDAYAFVLMTITCRRAWRENVSNIHGLEVNQALIGDYDKYNMTEQIYRTRKDRLIKWGFITCRTTNKGTIATVLSKDIYDINATQYSEKNNGRIMTNKKEKIDKKEKENIKKKLGEIVSITEKEYEKLVEQFGKTRVDEEIDNMNNYCMAHGKQYKSYYHALINWCKKPQKRGFLNGKNQRRSTSNELLAADNGEKYNRRPTKKI